MTKLKHGWIDLRCGAQVLCDHAVVPLLVLDNDGRGVMDGATLDQARQVDILTDLFASGWSAKLGAWRPDPRGGPVRMAKVLNPQTVDGPPPERRTSDALVDLARAFGDLGGDQP